MSEQERTNGDKPAALTAVTGDRRELERELLWNIALDGDLVRREQLYRMLTPDANTELAIAPAIEPSEVPPRE